MKEFVINGIVIEFAAIIRGIDIWFFLPILLLRTGGGMTPRLLGLFSGIIDLQYDYQFDGIIKPLFLQGFYSYVKGALTPK